MGQNSAIEWTHHTFNPWVGCTKVSQACDHCYAETWAKRTGQAALWQGERRRTSDANWQQPHRWNAAAARDGKRARVFCASLADVFDNQVPAEWRQDLWHLIDKTQHLDWLLLTKRPQNINSMLPIGYWSGTARPWPWQNVWLGTTVENQAEADRRIPHLLATPAAVRFLSCEPLLGAVNLERIGGTEPPWTNALSGLSYYAPGTAPIGPRIDWVIAGGESGHGARAMHPDWARNLRDQCAAAGVPFFFKQWGEWAPSTPDEAAGNPRSGWRCTAGHPHVARREELYPEAGAAFVAHVGKKAAGRLLDGIEHNALPAWRDA
jgi:protein gp37